jgi:hypothetical protein
MTPDVVPTPPRWAERLLRWSLAPDERAAVLGDVQEEFAAIADNDPARAVRWYRIQTLASVVPNVARQIRNQWAEARYVINDEDRRARYRRLIGGLAVVACVGLIFGILAGIYPRHSSDWLAEGLIFATPGFLLAISSFYRTAATASGTTRGWLRSTAYFAWFALGVLHRADELKYALMALSVLTWMWPRAMWPFRRALAVRGFSVRSPVLTSFSRSAAFGTVTVPPEPWGMSQPIVGRAEPPSLPPGYQSRGVVPLLPAPAKTFDSGESVRVFAVVNANPEGLHGTLEVRVRGGRLLATIPAVVTPATPKLPYRHQHGIDPDSELPRLPDAPMSELNSVVSLAGLRARGYTLRLTASNGEGSSHQDTDITLFRRITGW